MAHSYMMRVPVAYKEEELLICLRSLTASFLSSLCSDYLGHQTHPAGLL